MTARLFTKNIDEDDFVLHEEVYEDDVLEDFKVAEEAGAPVRRPLSAAEKATADGERMCRQPDSRTDAFQVYILHSAKRRVISTEDIG